jgi:predicted acyltransferase (DUF342 family)
MMIMIFVLIAFFMLLLLPFIPGIVELRRPRDAGPLFIDMEYTKDPRYFGKSFKGIMKKLARSDVGLGMSSVSLSRREVIQVSHTQRVNKGKQFNHVLCIIGDIVTAEKVCFRKEIYVTGKATIGAKNMVRAIASDGKVFLDRKTTVLRWIDAEESIEVREGCDLGINISCGGEVRIARDCKFKRLYGFPVVTCAVGDEGVWKYDDVERAFNSTRTIGEGVFRVSPGSRIEKDLIVKNNLRISKNSLVAGNIKTYGELMIEEDVKISGNVFSEGNIRIGQNTMVGGDIFSQGSVIIDRNSQIGNPGKWKSVIGKSAVMLGSDVRVYGYILTEGSGIIL